MTYKGYIIEGRYPVPDPHHRIEQYRIVKVWKFSGNNYVQPCYIGRDQKFTTPTQAKQWIDSIEHAKKLLEKRHKSIKLNWTYEYTKLV